MLQVLSEVTVTHQEKKYQTLKAEYESVQNQLEAENAKLREQLRWRRWPEESPTETGYYIVWKFNLSYTPNGFYSVNSDSWDVMWKRFYWMPQMPLPEVES